MLARRRALIRNNAIWLAISLALLAGLLPLLAQRLPAIGPEPLEIQFYNFSNADTFIIPADTFSDQVTTGSTQLLGSSQAITLTRLQQPPPIPEQFGGDILKAVGAGGLLAGGAGFDAAHIPGARLNPVWGFLYNSGIPFGPDFDEYLGFLYGSPESNPPNLTTGLQRLQQTLDRANANVVVIPIASSSEQEAGYFPQPIGDAKSANGIGLAGLCAEPWTFRYLPPAQNVLDLACDQLVEDGIIAEKTINFARAVSGGGILDAVMDGRVQAFELFTPAGNLAALFQDPTRNPGTAGLRYVHLPSWHQPFLITYLIVNRDVWNQLSDAQRQLFEMMGREHVLSSYTENLSRQGEALQAILTINDNDDNLQNDMELVRWPDADLEPLRRAAVRFLDQQAENTRFSSQDREDYRAILAQLRRYIDSNHIYWQTRRVPPYKRLQLQ